jgi:hypothetical protein
MSIDSLDIVFYTAIFVLPGFIINGIIDTLNPPKKIGDSHFFLSCLAYSLVNCAVCSWAYILIKPFAEGNSVVYWILFLGITLIGAIAISILIGMIKQWRIISRIANRLHVKLLDPTPTAWDYWFSKQEGSLVLITLTDGSEIRGWFGNNSFASSDADERDIFIEKAYIKSADSEKWLDNPENNGLYISKNMIKLIELKKLGGNKNGE